MINFSQPWAITADAFDQLRKVAASTPAADFKPKAFASPTVKAGSAIIPIHGVLTARGGFWAFLTGGTSYAEIRAGFQRAIEDETVDRIILDINSPGGEVDGLAELAEEITAARSTKEIVAYVSNLGCSAAYWLACSAGKIIIHPTAVVGSIGTVLSICKDEGDVVDIVSSQSPKKVPDVATPEGRAQLQAYVDRCADFFIHAVARARGVTPADVVSRFGAGDVVFGEDAVGRGMADVVGNFKTALNRANEPAQAVQAAAPNVAPATLTHKPAPAARSKIKMTTNQKTKAAFVAVDDESVELPDGAESAEITPDWLKANLPDVAQALIDEGAAMERENQKEIEVETDPTTTEETKLVGDMRWKGARASEIVLALNRFRRDARTKGLADRMADQAPPASASHAGEAKPDLVKFAEVAAKKKGRQALAAVN